LDTSSYYHNSQSEAVEMKFLGAETRCTDYMVAPQRRNKKVTEINLH